MRLVHLDTGREMRGGQRQVLLLMRALAGAGHESILLAREGSPLQCAAEAGGFPVRPAHLKDIWEQSAAADLVHAHDARGHSLAALACRGVLVVSRRVAFPVNKGLPSRWKYRRARRYQAVSRFVADQLVAAGVASDRIDIVPDGVEDVAALESWDWQAPVIAPASSDPLKGRDLAAESASIAGTELVFSDNLSRDLRRASIFLYLTKSEGFGSAVLLSMRLGVPVVASRLGGLPEIIQHGVSGLLVDNRPAAVARSILEVKNNPNLAKHLIEGGRRRVEQNFTAEHLLRRTLASYRMALAR